MKCPVCKTECGERVMCPECGFDDINPSFINKNEVDEWKKHVVFPFRKKYWENLDQETRNQLIVEIELRDDLSFEFGSKEFVSHKVIRKGGEYFHLYHSVRTDYENNSMFEKNGDDIITKKQWNNITDTFWNTYLTFIGSDDDFCDAEYLICGKGVDTLSITLSNGISFEFERWPGSPVQKMISHWIDFPTNEPQNTVKHKIPIDDTEINIW